MRNEMCLGGELPTLEFIMREAAENKSRQTSPENQRLSRLYNLLAALQVLVMLGGAVVGLLIAPASLFVSQTDGEAFLWLAASLVALAQIALALLVAPLALTAAYGARRGRRYGRICGVIASALSIFAFPFGTIIGVYLLWNSFARREV